MTTSSIVIDRFNYTLMRQSVKVPLIVIYKNPSDFPGKYVARLFNLDVPTKMCAIADTYQEILKAIPRQIMVRFPRNMEDDKCIVETWV